MLVSPDAFRRLCRARDLLDEESESRGLTVSSVANDVAISRFHFIRQFEALFGATPHQWRAQVRIERAKQLLSRGNSSVTEVCMHLGFSSLGSFSDSFSRRVGVSPSAYQRNARVVSVVPASLAIPGCLGLLVEAYQSRSIAISEKRRGGS